jgi:DNA-directed RNA polymerase subunit RPC12/RpoP
MAEAKTSCPKCGGHIVFPKELAGQEIVCPHCNETILLPKLKSAMPWVITGILGFIVVCLASALVFELQKKGGAMPSTRLTEQATLSQDESTKESNGQVNNLEDDEAIKDLCKEFYDGLNNQDANALYNLLAVSCQKALGIEDMKKLYDGGAKYEFVGLDSVKYQSSALGMAAMAKVKRNVQDSRLGTQEGWRDLKFLKESNGWRLFRDEDLMDKIVRQFKGSLNDEINADIQLLRDGDPFDVWDKNNTNAFETIFKLNQRQPGIFPWNVEFNVESNSIDGFTLFLNYSVRNNSSSTWISPLLEFDLKRDGKVVLSGNDLLPDITSGRQLVRNTSFFLAGEPQETTKYDLDVYYPIGFPQKSIQIIQNVPLEFKVQKTSDLAKLEIISTQFDPATSEDFQDMLSARINYRVKNISTEAIKSLDIKCVWFAQTGEQLDQSTEYIVGYGDVPLGVGQFKTGFIRCGKGYRNLRVPVKVDVYLESGENRSLVFKGFLIN